MRLTLVPLAATILIFSCHNNTAVKEESKTPVMPPVESGDIKSSRHLLVAELKRLKAAFASGNAEKIAAIFPFPLADTTFGVYIDDSTYLQQFKENGGKTTRAMFISHFPQVYRVMQLQELNELFKLIEPDSMFKEDTILREVIYKNEPCYKYYSINIEKDNTTLIFGTASNENYTPSSAAENDMEENASEYCEYASFWMFNFDGRQLRFVKQTAEG